VPGFINYHIYLNDAFLAETEKLYYKFEDLNYTESYKACVAANYTSGLSEKVCHNFTSHYLYPPENLTAASYDNAIHLIWDVPLMPDTSKADRALWDTQFEFPCGDASGEYGIESDGNYIYTTNWNAGNGTFFRYELDGTFMGSFVVSGSCMDVRDLAYDGEYFYGSNASTTVWKMDFDNEVVVGAISAPISVRAIAYDPIFDGFWANNLSDNICLFDRNGIQLNSFQCGTYGNYTGFAFDNSQLGGPFLYGFSYDGSGAEIVEIEIATGQESGFIYDAIGFSSTGSGNSGGLYIQDDIIPGKRTLGGLIQNETIFGLDFGESGGTSYIVPENLLGFNVFRDGEYQEYVAYIDGQTEFELWQYHLASGLHEYEVTALYDLYPYNMPGDTASSEGEGPVIIRISLSYILPFMENWETGSFETRDWETETDNWVINDDIGNPGFSAEFAGQPEQTNYSSDLISFHIYPYKANDGSVLLDFDLKLIDIDAGGTEKLIIGTKAYDKIYMFDTLVNNGDLDWTAISYDISEFALDNNLFQLVFRAMGENSSNIEGWFIDNIHVYQMCNEPTNLTIEPEFHGSYSIAKLNWTPPLPHNHFLYYHDNTFENAVASIEAGQGIAQLFVPEFYPTTIHKVKLFVDEHLNYQNPIEVYVLSGDGNTILSGPKTVTPSEPNSWIFVDMEPVTIESGNYMVATISTAEDGPFIPVDNHLSTPEMYYGSIGNFTKLNNWGYNFVSSFEVLIDNTFGDNVVQNSDALKPVSKHIRPAIKMSGKAVQTNSARGGSRNLTGYNIYRNGESIDYNWPESNYADTLDEAGEYTYYISALYDQCESDTTGSVSISFFTNEEETSSVNELIVYPNPAHAILNIKISDPDEKISHFTLTSIKGQIVLEQRPFNNQISLDISGIAKGLYIIQVKTNSRNEFKKIMIN
jgi:Secretion system C-terminal sorting domain